MSMEKFPTTNKLPIPNNIDFNNKPFKSIKLSIDFGKENTKCQYYLHNCVQVEFQEISQEQSKYNPETIYFFTSEGSYSTTQPNSNRIEVNSVPQDQSQNTLYFINEGESEP